MHPRRIPEITWCRLYPIVSALILESLVTCPRCGHQKLEIMPKDACEYFYECIHCKELLKPKSGDCCRPAGDGNKPSVS
jgi:hypothetical protein